MKDNRLVTYCHCRVDQGQCTYSLEDGPDEGPVLKGRAVVFNAISSDITPDGSQIYDTFLPTAFDRCLSGNPEVFALYNHNWDHPLGKVSNGRLKLYLQDDGIYSELRPSNTSKARDLIELVKDGTVGGMSFGCYINEFEWDFSDPVKSYRVISDADIFEVTWTPIPSFSETTAEVVLKSGDKVTQEVDRLRREIERKRKAQEDSKVYAQRYNQLRIAKLRKKK